MSELGAWPSGGGGGVVSELGDMAKWRRWRSGVRAWCMHQVEAGGPGLGPPPSPGGGGVVSELGDMAKWRLQEWCQSLVHAPSGGGGGVVSELVHTTGWRWRSGIRAWCMATWRHAGVVSSLVHGQVEGASTPSTWPCTKL